MQTGIPDVHRPVWGTATAAFLWRRHGGGAGVARLPLRVIAPVALCLALFYGPYEVPVIRVRGLLVTTVELVAAVAVVSWVADGIVGRRWRWADRWFSLALIALAAATLAAGVFAPFERGAAVRFAARTGLMLATGACAAAVLSGGRRPTWALGTLLVGASASAALGVAGYALDQGGSDLLDGVLGKRFIVGSATRVRGTFDYPNTAGMFWEATVIACLPLALIARGGTRLAVGAALGVLAAALILTYSRGAVVGTLAGLAAAGVAATAIGERRFAVAAAIAAAVVGIGAAGWYSAGPVPLARLATEGEAGWYQAAFIAPGELRMAPGMAQTVQVTVTNTGTVAWSGRSRSSWALSYHWLEATAGTVVDFEGVRTPFVSSVAPGGRATVAARVVAPPLAGEYVLAWDVVEEDVAWVSQHGGHAGATAVVVAGPAPTGEAAQFESGAPEAIPMLAEVVPPAGRPPAIPGRFALWRAARVMFEGHPVFGVGPGSYRLVYGRYLGWSAWDTRISANNWYLEQAATTGTVGLAALGVALFVVVWRQARGLWRARTGGSTTGKLLVLGLLGATIAFLTHGLVDYFNAFAPTGLLFWILAGVGTGLAGRLTSALGGRG